MGFFREAYDMIFLIVFTVSSVMCGSNRSQFRKDAYLGLCSIPFDTVERGRAINIFLMLPKSWQVFFFLIQPVFCSPRE